MKDIVKVRIKRGTIIGHDLGAFIWPGCKPPRNEYPNNNYKYETKFPDAIFEGEWSGFSWTLKRPGYGFIGKNNYGNGAIHIEEYEGVEEIDE